MPYVINSVLHSLNIEIVDMWVCFPAKYVNGPQCICLLLIYKQIIFVDVDTDFFLVSMQIFHEPFLYSSIFSLPHSCPINSQAATYSSHKIINIFSCKFNFYVMLHFFKLEI